MGASLALSLNASHFMYSIAGARYIALLHRLVDFTCSFVGKEKHGGNCCADLSCL